MLCFQSLDQEHFFKPHKPFGAKSPGSSMVANYQPGIFHPRRKTPQTRRNFLSITGPAANRTGAQWQFSISSNKLSLWWWSNISGGDSKQRDRSWTTDHSLIYKSSITTRQELYYHIMCLQLKRGQRWKESCSLTSSFRDNGLEGSGMLNEETLSKGTLPLKAQARLKSCHGRQEQSTHHQETSDELRKNR